MGITLIRIPYWWDHTFNSIEATVYKHRKDLFKNIPTGKVFKIKQNFNKYRHPNS